MESATQVTARNPIPLYSLFIANAISLVGNVFANIAVPWFVLQTTGSATQTGITGFFTILPVVLAGFSVGRLSTGWVINAPASFQTWQAGSPRH